MRTILQIIVAFISIVGIIVLYLFLQHWIAYQTGSYNVTGSPHNYNFWSGFGSDMGEVTLIGVLLAGMAGWYHKHNCHVEKCWKIGIHPVAGGTYSVCRGCHNKITGHPHKRFTIAHLTLEHKKHEEAMAAR